MPKWRDVPSIDGWCRRIPFFTNRRTKHRTSPLSPVSHVHLGVVHLKTKPFSFKTNPSSATTSTKTLASTTSSSNMASQTSLLSTTCHHPSAPSTTNNAHFRPLSIDQLTELLKWLPLPPNPNHLAWKNRCFDCFQATHAPGACEGNMVCLKCLSSGHPARACPKNRRSGKDHRNDATKPRGNKGDSLLPPHRPEVVHAFVHENPSMSEELSRLGRAIVVDAHFVNGHSLQSVKHDLTKHIKEIHSIHLTHLNNRRYLLHPPKNLDSTTFLANRNAQLTELGYVLFPWSPSLHAEPMQSNFKVWLTLNHVPPHACVLEHITHVISSAGLILNHQPVYDLQSYDTVKLLLATTKLDLIPKSIALVIKGLQYIIPVTVTAWIEESFTFPLPPNTNPPDSVYEEVAQDVFARMMAQGTSSSSTSSGSARSGSPSIDPLDLAPKNFTGSLAIDKDLLADLIADAPECKAKHYLRSLLDENSVAAPSAPTVQEGNGQPNGALEAASSASTGEEQSCQLQTTTEPSIPPAAQGRPSLQQLDTAQGIQIPLSALPSSGLSTGPQSGPTTLAPPPIQPT